MIRVVDLFIQISIACVVLTNRQITDTVYVPAFQEEPDLNLWSGPFSLPHRDIRVFTQFVPVYSRLVPYERPRMLRSTYWTHYIKLNELNNSLNAP